MTNTAWHYRGSKAFKQWLARNRHRSAVQRLGRYAWQIVLGYENSSHDFAHNGERFLVENVATHTSASVLFDVGANVGDWSDMALQLCPRAQIHAFEIAPVTQRKLQARFESTPEVVVNHFGLNADGESLELYYYPENDTLSSVVDYPHGGSRDRLTVHCRTGDAYVAETLAQTQEIDLLKVDVEGAEPYVFEGFGETLKAGRIRVIQFEYGRANIITGFLLRDIYPLLEACGFVVGKLYPNYVAFKEYELADENFIGPNFVAVRRDQSDLIDSMSI